MSEQERWKRALERVAADRLGPVYMAMMSRAQRAEVERDELVQRVAELEAEASALRRRNAHLETTVTASLGAKVMEVARLERELVIARAAIPEMVTCSGCGCHAHVKDLNWNTRDYHFTRHGLCGHWTKEGKPWKLDCEHPADVVEGQTEVGDE